MIGVTPVGGLTQPEMKAQAEARAIVYAAFI